MGSNCYLGNAWNDTFCPDSESGGLTCAQNCNLEGADEEYVNTYSVTAKDDALTLGFVTPVSDNGTNVGSRTYLLTGPTPTTCSSSRTASSLLTSTCQTCPAA